MQLKVCDSGECLGWTQYVQPEGQLYFVSTPETRSIRFVTEEHLYDTTVLEKINKFADVLENTATSMKSEYAWEHMEVFLELREQESMCYMA